MAYRLKLKESLAKGVRRIACDQLLVADSRLAESSDPVAAVHEARKCLKRTRALLRLVRPGLGEHAFRDENHRLAAIGRQLSGQRDAHVVAGLLARLAAEHGPVGPAASRMLEGLGATEGDGGGRLDAARLREVRAALGEAHEAASALKLSPATWDMVASGLAQSYKLGRKALVHADADPQDVESLHDLRKACQVHWRQMLLLARAWPEAMAVRAQAAKEIAQLLGDDHDIELLMARLQPGAAGDLSARDRAALVGWCDGRHRQLRAQGLARARRLFADRPRRFGHHIMGLWSVAQASVAREDESEGRTASSTAAADPDAVERAALPSAAEPREAPRRRTSASRPLAHRRTSRGT